MIGVSWNTVKTIGEAFDILCSAEDKNEALYLFNEYVQFIMRKNKNLTKDEAIKIAKENISYFAGYYSTQTQAKMRDLFE